MRQETTSFYYTLCEYTPGPEGGSQRLLKSSLRDATTDLQTESRKISRHFALSLLPFEDSIKPPQLDEKWSFLDEY